LAELLEKYTCENRQSCKGEDWQARIYSASAAASAAGAAAGAAAAAAAAFGAALTLSAKKV
jgi:hypothetical protein